MKNRQFRLIDAAESGVGFARNLKRPPPRVSEAAKRLEEAVESARVAGQDQIRAKAFRKTPRYSVTRAKTILLRKHLGPIAADGIEMLAGLPGIRESLKLPRIKDAPEKHLEATKRVRRVAEDHEKEFIDERNYDENFLNSFDGAVRDLEGAAGVDKGVGRAKYTRATADVKEEMARLRRAFDVLDTRMVQAYLDDPSTLELWRGASRVRAKTGRPRKRKTGRKRADINA